MKKWQVRSGLVLAVILLIIASVWVFFYVRGKSHLAKKITELKAQGIPTDYAELEAKYKLPEGTPNAADIYLKAFAAYKPLLAKQLLLPVLGNRPGPEDNEPYPDDQIAAAKEFIEQNQAMFTLLTQGGEIRDCYYPMEYAPVPSVNTDIWQGIKRAAQSLAVAEVYYSQTNQPQEACHAVMEQLRLGQSLSRNPLLINYLIRIALLSMGLSSTQEVINRTSPDETQLRQLQEYLQQIDNSMTISPAMVGEICFYLEYKKAGKAITLPVNNTAQYYAGKLLPENFDKLIEIHQRMMEIDKLPIQEQPAKVHKLTANGAGLFDMLTGTILPSIEKIHMIHLRFRASMDCAITGLAVERYRLKNGTLPETVNEIVPDYLAEVYIDPFDGKPLRYKQTEPGYIIYTVGEDGVDDGGLERDPNNRTTTFDYAFCVYR